MPEYDYTDYGLTPEQYHAGVDRLWAAMPDLKGPQIEDVFTLASCRIKLIDKIAQAAAQATAQLLNKNQTINAELLEALQALLGEVTDYSCAREVQDKARAAIAKAHN